MRTPSRLLASLVAAGLFAWAGKASAAISVVITAPVADKAFDGTVRVTAAITTTNTITNVTAHVSGRDYVFATSGISGSRSFDLDPSVFPRGPLTISVTATNVLGETATTATRTFYYDARPTVTFTLPIDGTVGKPDMRFVASCTANGVYPCNLISVTTGTLGPDSRASGPVRTSLDETRVGRGDLCVIAETTVGLSSYVCREGLDSYAPPSNLVKVGEVDGPIVDADSTRILYWVRVPCGTTTCKENRIYDRATGAVTVLPSSGYTHLTNQGAIGLLNEWRAGVSYPLPPEVVSIAAKGDIALFKTGIPGEVCCGGDVRNRTMYHRNTATGVERVVGTGTIFLSDPIVADNGDAVFYMRTGSGGHVHRVRNGVVSQISGAFSRYNGLKTDGINVVAYVTDSPGEYRSIDIFPPTGTQGTLFSAPNPAGFQSFTGGYTLNGGYVLWAGGASTPGEYYLRQPGGATSLFPIFATAMDATASTFLSSDTTRRFVYRAGQPNLDIAAIDFGRFVTIAGEWHIVAGNTLYRMDLTGAASGGGDAGAGDAGASDAGGTADAGDLDAGDDGGSSDAASGSDASTTFDSGLVADAGARDAGSGGSGSDAGGGSGLDAGSSGGAGPGEDPGVSCSSTPASGAGAVVPSLVVLGALAFARRRRAR